jgi:hypothetical protein
MAQQESQGPAQAPYNDEIRAALDTLYRDAGVLFRPRMEWEARARDREKWDWRDVDETLLPEIRKAYNRLIDLHNVLAGVGSWVRQG